jgi:hemolysin activation/secretion protein/opacity protein-like surface antigen
LSDLGFSKSTASRLALKASLSILALCVGAGATLVSIRQASAQFAPQSVPGVDSARDRVNPTQVAPEPTPPPRGGVGLSLATAGRAGAPANAAKIVGVVRHVRVEGTFAEVPQSAEPAAKLEGRRVSLADVYAVAAEIQAAYATAGYPLVQVGVQRADLGSGDVRFAVVDGYFESLDLSKVPERERELARERLQPLVGKKHITSAEIERRVLLLGDIAGLVGGAKLTLVGKTGGVILGIEAEQKLVQAALGVNNLLPKEQGTWSVPLALSLNNAFGWGENIHAEVSTGRDIGNTFNGTGKLQAYGAGVALPVFANGLTFSAGLTGVRGSPDVPPFVFSIPAERERTNFQKVYARLTYPVLLTLKNTVRVQFGYDHTDYQVKAGPYPVFFNLTDGPLYGIARDRYDSVRVAGEWITRFPWELGGQSSAALFFVRGLGGRGASPSNPYDLVQHSRPYSSPQFSKLKLDWRVVQPLPESFQLSAWIKAQTSFGASLMLPEALSLDGADGVSGFAAGTLNVDRGIVGRLELGRSFSGNVDTTRYSATPYIFAAAGTGIHEAPFFSLPPFPSEQKNMRAASLGGGVRADANLFGGPVQESIALELAKSYSNIPYRSSGFRANLSYIMRYGGTPFALPAPNTRANGQLPFWTGLYAGLNAGYSFGQAGNSTIAVPAITGANLGGVNFSGASALAASGSARSSTSGYIGGAQFGANSQFDRVVLGFETDIQGAGIRSQANPRGFGTATDGFTIASVSSGTLTENNINVLGTVRARAGFLATPTLLAYGTGGFAYGSVKTHSLLTQAWTGGIGAPVLRPTGARLDGGTVRGGWTAGAGVEWMFANNLSLKAEYLYYDLGAVQTSAGFLGTATSGMFGLYNTVVGTGQARLNGHILRAGLNYHFNGLDPAAPLASRFTKGPLAAVATAQPARWGGFYAGLNAGYSWNSSNSLTIAGAPAGNALDTGLAGIPYGAASAFAANGQARPSVAGGMAGAQAGYNALFGAWALGAEADIDGAGLRGRAATFGLTNVADGVPASTVLSGTEAQKSIDWLATARARVGFVATPRLLAYGTAGLAFGGVSAQAAVNQQWSGAFGSNFSTIGAVGRYSDVKVGWTAGAGVEWMFAPQVSLKAEYLYYDLGSTQFSNSLLATSFTVANTTATNVRTRFNGQLARVGLNYHFDMPGVVEPIVTRY